MGRAVGASPAEIGTALTQQSIEGINLQRVFSHKPRLERLDLLSHADAGTPISLTDPMQTVIGNDLDEGICARPLKYHRLDITNLEALFLRGRQEMVARQ